MKQTNTNQLHKFMLSQASLTRVAALLLVGGTALACSDDETAGDNGKADASADTDTDSGEPNTSQPDPKGSKDGGRPGPGPTEPGNDDAAVPDPTTDGGTVVADAGGPGTPVADAGEDPMVCRVLCDSLAANCQNANAQYPDNESCAAACEAMPAGERTDTAGNTASCRARVATKAELNEKLCPSAGTASDVCGTVCEGYCSQVMTNCIGKNAQYQSEKECLDTCEKFPLGTPNDTMGNSVHCRAYHASFPAAADPNAHCGHAGKNGDKVCAGRVIIEL